MLFLLAAVQLAAPTAALRTGGAPRAVAPRAAALRSTTVENAVDAPARVFHEASRYMSTSRFLVSKDDATAFEQQWVARKSKIGDAPGFRYFHLSKRAADFMGPPLGDDEPNYVSYAVWDTKADFEAYLAVDDFGGERADYDGLFTLSLPPNEAEDGIFNAVEGWRVADEAATKPKREAFVASNRFGIKPGFETDFESMWAGRDSSLKELDGFRNFALLRRVGPVADGDTYVSYTTWRDVQAFNGWRGSDNFKRSHNNNRGDGESPYSKMPKVVTFKCFLCLSSPNGA